VTRDQLQSAAPAGQAGAATVSKPEAIRRAIAALGNNAQVPQILDYVREHFGIGTAPAEPAEGALPRREARAGEAAPEELPDLQPLAGPEAEEPAEPEPAPQARKAPARRGRSKDRPSS
jgi:hypothetical protein